MSRPTDTDTMIELLAQIAGNTEGKISLRDCFAAKALPIAATFYDTSDEVVSEAASWCYKMADAMLKARDQ